MRLFGGLAQLVEQLIYTEKVTGSSPVSPTKYTPPGLLPRWGIFFTDVKLQTRPNPTPQTTPSSVRLVFQYIRTKYVLTILNKVVQSMN